MRSKSTLLVVAGLLGVTVFGAMLTPAASRQPGGADVLAWLPGEMIGFVHLKGEALWNHPGVKAALAQLPAKRAKELAPPVEALKRMLGVDLASVRTATGYVRRVNLRSQEVSFAVALSSEKAFDKKAVAEALRQSGNAKGQAESYQSVDLLPAGIRGDDQFVAAVPEANVLLYGEIEGVKALLDGRARPKAGGALAAAVAEAGKRDVTLAVILPEEVRGQLKQLM